MPWKTSSTSTADTAACDEQAASADLQWAVGAVA